MSQIAVVYFSKTGVTEQLTEAFQQGADSVLADSVRRYRIRGEDIVHGRFVQPQLLQDLGDCQAMVWASPTYMGNVSAQFKAFADATSELWCEQAWSGKLAAGITCGSALNGDQSNSLQYMATLASQHGMLWVGLDAASGYRDRGINRMGCQLGVLAHAPDGQADAQDLATAQYLGGRIAHQIIRIQAEPQSER